MAKQRKTKLPKVEMILVGTADGRWAMAPDWDPMNQTLLDLLAPFRYTVQVHFVAKRLRDIAEALEETTPPKSKCFDSAEAARRGALQLVTED